MAAIATLLAQSEAALARCSLSTCIEKAREATEAVTRVGGDARLQRRARNLLGIGEHLSGHYANAQLELSEALSLAEAAARRGEAHDAYIDLVGCLVDLAANSIRPQGARVGLDHLTTRSPCDAANLAASISLSLT